LTIDEQRIFEGLPNLEYSTIVDSDVDRILEFARHGDLGATGLFIEMHGSALRYVRQAKQFYVSDRTRFIPDGGDRVLAFAQDVSRRLYGLANLEQSKERREELAKFGLRFESRKLLESVVALAKGFPAVAFDARAFDADPFLLNTDEGVVDLRTGKLRDARDGEFFTKLAGTHYDPDAKCPRWLQFLDEVFCDGIQTFVQRLVGMSITGSQAEQVLPICYGTGANGKSTFLDVIRYVMGDYALACGSDTFLRRENKSATNDLARLAGARFVTSIETEDGRTLSEGLVKSVTGGDPITARFLFREFFEFVPQFTLWLATNHRPIVRGTDFAIWRRLVLIPFQNSFQGAARENNLAQRLRDEAPGILAWAVRGCLAWQIDGLRTPEAVRIATETYRSDMDVLRPFFDDRCVIGADESVAAADLYTTYRAWAEKNGERIATSQAFGRRLNDRGFRSERTTRARMWRGISLAPLAVQV
jgi:putative DNA primase/helicase